MNPTAKLRFQPVKQLLMKYALPIKAGLLVAAMIVFSEILNLFVLYRYLKLDYYLCLVAVCFLLIGWWMRKPVTTVNSHVIAEPAAKPVNSSPLQLLTAREIDILQLIAAGKTNKEIAAAQFVEMSTVKTHINNIYAKLTVSNRQEARQKYAEMTEK